MSFRKQRVSEMLQSFISDQFLRMRDPRIAGIQICSVEVTGDLRHAKVYWSFLVTEGSEAEKLRPEAEQAFAGLKGFLKKKIAEQLELKYIPELHFEFDNSAVTGANMDRLLNSLSKNATE